MYRETSAKEHIMNYYRQTFSFNYVVINNNVKGFYMYGSNFYIGFL